MNLLDIPTVLRRTHARLVLIALDDFFRRFDSGELVWR